MGKQKRLYKKDIDRDRVRHKRIIFNLIFQTRKEEIKRKGEWDREKERTREIEKKIETERKRYRERE